MSEMRYFNIKFSKNNKRSH